MRKKQASKLNCRVVVQPAVLGMCKKEKLQNAVIERAQEIDGRKKLMCAQAFELAGEFGVEIIEIGRVCNRQNIKIAKCQLGCFKDV